MDDWQQGLAIFAFTIVALIVIAVVFALPTPEDKRRADANAHALAEARAANEWLEKKQQQCKNAASAAEIASEETLPAAEEFQEAQPAADTHEEFQETQPAAKPQEEFHAAVPIAEPAADPLHVCWGCGSFGDGYKTCAKCVEQKLPSPCRFCSPACLKANWPRHKQWHVEQLRDTEARESLHIAEALRVVEHSSERSSETLAVAKRSDKKKGSAAGVQALRERAIADAAQLSKAERRQVERERTLLTDALNCVAQQLERDNENACAATRAGFGQVVAHIDESLDVRHSEAQLDACFAACAVQGDDDAPRVDLLAFLREESTLDWFLCAGHEGSRPRRGKSKCLR
jgi:hypothetical protein